MEIIELPIKALKPYKRNPRKNDKAVEYVANSIRQFGFKVPIVIDGNYEIVCGHTRWKAAKVIGLESVPCIMADDLNEDQIRAFRLADNKTAEMADWDFDLLEMEFNDIDPELFDMSDFGFFQDDEETEDKAPTEVTEDDFDESTVTEAVCKRGQVWKLGEHRLMCGDSTNADDVAHLMNGEKADMVFTDPPYGIKADKGFSGRGEFAERRHYKDDWDAERPDKEVFDFICKTAKNCIIFGGNFFSDVLPVGNHWLVWNKHNTMPTFLDAELAWTNIKRNSVKLYDVQWNGLIGKEKERFHPTQKPVKLFAEILNDYTEPKEIVLDPFGGSGTTMLACEQLDRRCFMMEISEHYCDVIIRRWENLTGQKAELLEK